MTRRRAGVEPTMIAGQLWSLALSLGTESHWMRPPCGFDVTVPAAVAPTPRDIRSRPSPPTRAGSISGLPSSPAVRPPSSRRCAPWARWSRPRSSPRPASYVVPSDSNVTSGWCAGIRKDAPAAIPVSSRSSLRAACSVVSSGLAAAPNGEPPLAEVETRGVTAAQQGNSFAGVEQLTDLAVGSLVAHPELPFVHYASKASPSLQEPRKNWGSP